MKYISITVFVFISFVSLNAQSSCFPNGLVLSSQEEIDNFALLYSECTTIEGLLIIGGGDADGSIVNLDGLSQLDSIHRLVIVFNSSLTSLSGLEGLKKIRKSLEIRSNPLLDNLSGLEGISSLGDNVYIGKNAALSSLSGLQNLAYIEGNLLIENNTSLESLSSLSNLTSVEGLSIKGNSVLHNLSGLEGLNAVGNNLSLSGNLKSIDELGSINDYSDFLYVHIGPNDSLSSLTGLEWMSSIGYLRLIDNNALTDLSGLENLDSVSSGLQILDNRNLLNLFALVNLKHVGVSLLISSNDNLLSLSGLGNLNTVDGMLGIMANPSLTNIEGLGGIDHIEGILNISYNILLPECSIEPICAYLEDADNFANSVIEGNAENCATPMQVLDHCNGVTDVTDQGIEQRKINIFPNPGSGMVNIGGPNIELLTVFSSAGQMLVNLKNPDQLLDFSHLPDGIYWLKVVEKNGIYIERWIKR